MSPIGSNSQFSKHDATMMAKALQLAQKGRFSTTPNPHVGCVITDVTGHIIGQGFHKKAGQAHAEVMALLQTQENAKDAKDATVYVTLEPCAHQGKTGPCAQALIDAKVKKVVIACVDPNPQVGGKGIAMLKAAGIEVSLGLMKEQAEQVNRFFFHRIKHKRPFVTLKLAASLDGKTALANGESKWITSLQARKDVQRYRASACAILTGADTVIADDPRLNVRIQELPVDIAEQFSWRAQQPLRVVLDSQNRLHANKYQIFQDGHPTLVYNSAHNSRLADKSYKLLKQQQLDLVQSESREYLNLRSVLENLGSKGINHCWVEGGETLSGALFELSLVDRLILYQAPKLLGRDAKGLCGVTPKSTLSEAIEGKILSVDMVGPDVKTIIEFSH